MSKTGNANRDNAFKIGVIGHRDLGNLENQSYVHSSCHRLLSATKKKHSNIIAISAISVGADSVFAQSAISLGIQLESIIPFQQFESDFEEDLTNERYKSLRSKSKYETIANFSKRNNFAYRRSMEWLIFKSDIIIAVWDGVEKGSIGGTWEAVSLCMKIKKPLIHVNNKRKRINLYKIKNDKYNLSKNLSIEEVLNYF